jgi:excisionase family DNA binding protein
MKHANEPEPLLTPSEVAAKFRVDPKTVTRWAKAGRLSAIRTLGGHRRYRESEVKALLARVERTTRPPIDVLPGDDPALCNATDNGFSCSTTKPHPGQRHTAKFGAGVYVWGYEPTAAEAAARRVNGGA